MDRGETDYGLALREKRGIPLKFFLKGGVKRKRVIRKNWRENKGHYWRKLTLSKEG